MYVVCFRSICSYLFSPAALVMGVAWKVIEWYVVCFQSICSYLFSPAASVMGMAWKVIDMYLVCFQSICSYIFSPAAFVMGVAWKDCLKVGELIGSTIFLNGFFSYVELAKLIKNRQAGLSPSLEV